MPTAFDWIEYDVRVDVPPRPEAAHPTFDRSADQPLAQPTVTTLALPDLRPQPDPIAKARILLQSAAEIEHALMVQYLYAAYSPKGPDEAEPLYAQMLDDTLDTSWPQTLLTVAREEMGHLMTVQNLLAILGFQPHLAREQFPPPPGLYPFDLHLQPLTQQSLAKYVVAEAPAVESTPTPEPV